MVKKLTAYEAQKIGKAGYEMYEAQRKRDEDTINNLKKQLEPIKEIEKMPIELHIKEYSCYITREYLKTVVAQIQPIADVIQLDWKRR